MKHLIYFIAGVLLIVLTSATTFSVMTVKPQLPKVTIVKGFNDCQDIGNISTNIQNFCLKQIKKGYIVKSITFGGASCTKGVVVLEKY